MALKFEVHIGGVAVLMTAEQLDKMLALINECERFDEKFVGNNKGTPGTSSNAYLKQVLPVHIHEVSLKAHNADVVDALRFATKVHNESN
jgi:hypothetical protein